MERLRSLTRRAEVVAPALLAAYLAAGCTTAKPVEIVTDTFKNAVSLDKPEPATQVVCFWQRRLSHLPDPTRDGAQTSGIAGQMFLISPSNTPADVTGELGVVVFDETPRQAGQTRMQPEYWHYGKDTLKRLVTADERFGKSVVLFLPWPANWQGNVTAVKIAARYMSPGNPDLFAGEVHLALDFSTGGPVWSDVGQSDNRSVPDPSRMLQQAQAAAANHPFPTSSPVQASATSPATATPTTINWPTPGGPAQVSAPQPPVTTVPAPSTLVAPPPPTMIAIPAPSTLVAPQPPVTTVQPQSALAAPPPPAMPVIQPPSAPAAPPQVLPGVGMPQQPIVLPSR